MKLTAFLVIAACLQVSARVFSQGITLSAKNTPLVKVLKSLERQTGYSFWYKRSLLEESHPVNIELKDATLTDALKRVFQDQPLTFEIIDKIVVLRERPMPPAALASPVGPSDAGGMLNIRGCVTDSTMSPLVGASISVKGSVRGVASDVRGDFALKGLTEGTVIVVSYTGFLSQEIVISAHKPGYPFQNIALQRSQNELDATVIQGYGTTSKRFNVGSISTVDAATIEKQPVMNVLQALEGQAPGLVVNTTSGAPGSAVLVQVRGQNSLNSSPGGTMIKPYNQPLFIVDGVPSAAQNGTISQLASLANNNYAIGGTNLNVGLTAFNSINPADIESITVLRDADATSIYGTQGSNGVVLITTKKGKAGKTIFNLDVNTGFNTAAREVRLMNTQQYLQMRKEAFAADSATPSSNPYAGLSYAPDLIVYDQNRYTNWEKVIYGKTSNNTDVHGSLSGGDFNNTFLLSGGYTRSDYNYPGSFAEQRLTLHSTYHHVSPDNRLTVDLVMDFGYDQNNSSSAEAVPPYSLLPPNTPALLDSTGNLIWNYEGVLLPQIYGYLKRPAGLQVFNQNSSLKLNYKILSVLSFTANLGYSRNTNNEYNASPAAAQDYNPPLRTASFAANNFQTINLEPQLDYSDRIGKGVLTALVGSTYKKNTNASNITNGTGYASDVELGSINGATAVWASDNASLYKYAALFGRLKYVYDQKYILSLTGRRDGSSNFGPGRQFGDFGSVGGGWIFSEEKLIRMAVPAVSFGKLSANYGTSGSDGIAPYQYQSFWHFPQYAGQFQGNAPAIPQNLFNPDYSWALKKSLNLSLDLGVFHDHLMANVTFYHDREGNQLGEYPLPSQTGFNSVVQNLPADIQNQGWEFSFTSHNIDTRRFAWTTTFNIGFNRNKLLSLPGLASSPYRFLYMIGKSTSIEMGYKYAGVDPGTGLFQFDDQQGNKTFNPIYDLPSNGGAVVPIADDELKYTGGFGNTFTYTRFSLYVFFQFSSQTAQNYLYTIYLGNYPGTTEENQPAALAGKFWQKPGDVASLQRLYINTVTLSPAFALSNPQIAAENFVQSSGVYSDDTWLRLKTVALSYLLPDRWLKREHVHDFKIYVNAQNLLTFTDWKVGDPEMFSNFTGLPVQRTIAFGLNCNF